MGIFFLSRNLAICQNGKETKVSEKGLIEKLARRSTVQLNFTIKHPVNNKAVVYGQSFECSLLVILDLYLMANVWIYLNRAVHSQATLNWTHP